MYGFLVRPRWIVSHVLILALVVTMVNLGFWQLRRLDERRALNAKIAANVNAPAADLAEVAAGVETVTAGDEIDYRATTVAGTYLTDEEILIPSRDNGGGPGQWVATPLRTDGGAVVLVLRGSIPAAMAAPTPPVAEVEPPDGRVTIVGWVRRSEAKGTFQPSDARIDGHRFSRIDLPRIAEVLGLPLLPVLVQLREQRPATRSELVTPIPLPELTEGSHLSYAIQWFIFSTIALVGYPLALRRVARNRARSDGEAGNATASTEPEPEPEPDAEVVAP